MDHFQFSESTSLLLFLSTGQEFKTRRVHWDHRNHQVGFTFTTRDRFLTYSSSWTMVQNSSSNNFQLWYFRLVGKLKMFNFDTFHSLGNNWWSQMGFRRSAWTARSNEGRVVCLHNIRWHERLPQHEDALWQVQFCLDPCSGSEGKQCTTARLGSSHSRGLGD